MNAAKLRTHPEPNGRQICLTARDVIERTENLPHHPRDMARYSAATMHRRENIAGLKWEWIDFKRSVLFIPGTEMKNGEDFCVPLNA